MKLSVTMQDRLIEITDAATARKRAIGAARNRTDGALERRGLIQRVEIPWSENVAVILTPEGAKEADRLRTGHEEAEEALMADSSGRRYSDWWTVTNKSGDEIARVQGETMADANRAARGHQVVRETSRREGGFSLRGLYADELTDAETEIPAPQHDHSAPEEIARRAEAALPKRTPGAPGGVQDAINRHHAR